MTNFRIEYMDGLSRYMGDNYLKLRKEVNRESFSPPEQVAHRLEFVGMIHQRMFVNDSKATNINSTWYALERINKPIVLILGGVDKGNDWSMLSQLIKEKVKGIVWLGEMHYDFDLPAKTCKTMAAVVGYCYNFAMKGDVVLLSPACASFDLFENYEDRGQQFRAEVKAL